MLSHFSGSIDSLHRCGFFSSSSVFVLDSFRACALSFEGSAIYSPGYQSIMMDFGISQVVASLGLSLFVAGYAVGPLFLSAASEIPQVGRNPPYVGCTRAAELATDATLIRSAHQSKDHHLGSLRHSSSADRTGRQPGRLPRPALLGWLHREPRSSHWWRLCLRHGSSWRLCHPFTVWFRE